MNGGTVYSRARSGTDGIAGAYLRFAALLDREAAALALLGFKPAAKRRHRQAEYLRAVAFRHRAGPPEGGRVCSPT